VRGAAGNSRSYRDQTFSPSDMELLFTKLNLIYFFKKDLP